MTSGQETWGMMCCWRASVVVAAVAVVVVGHEGRGTVYTVVVAAMESGHCTLVTMTTLLLPPRVPGAARRGTCRYDSSADCSPDETTVMTGRSTGGGGRETG